jgi:hypothetical protein
MMIFTSLLLLLATSARGQTVYDAAHNVTAITGTWSSGSRNVITGPVSCVFDNSSFPDSSCCGFKGFATPSQEGFTYPKTTGMSYSL